MTSTSELAILLTGKDQASSVLGHVGQSARGMGSALGNVASMAGGFVVAQGLLAMPGILLDAAKAAAEDAASVAKLKTAVENTGASWDKYNSQLTQTINSGIKKGFSDSSQRDALSLLTAQTGSAEEAQKRMAMAMDLARGANIPLETASKLLGKVTEENVNVLGRYGLAVSKGTTETELFAKIQEKFGGQADTFADSTAGKMEAFNLAMGELQESLGGAVLPLLTALADVATGTLMPAIEEHLVPAFEAFGQVMAAALETAMPLFFELVDAIAPLVEMVVSTLAPVMETLFNTWTEHMGGLVSAVTQAFQGDIGGAIQTLLETLGNTVSSLVEHFATWAAAFIDWIGPMIPGMLEELLKVISGVLDFIIEKAPDILAQLAQWGLQFIEWIGPRIIPMIEELGKLSNRILAWAINEVLPKIGEALAKWGLAFLEWVVKNVIPDLPAELGKILDAISTWITNTAGTLKSSAEALGKSIIEGVKNSLDNLGSILQGIVSRAIGNVDFGPFRVNGGNISINLPRIPSLDDLRGGISSPLRGGFSPAFGAAAGGAPLVFNFHSPVYGVQDIQDTVVQALSDAARRGRVSSSLVRV